MKRQFEVEPLVVQVAESIRDAGGTALLVGGWIRDRLLDLPSKDYDFEVYGLTLERLEKELARYGEVIAVGRAFGVFRVKGLDIDFSIPRRDSKTGRGHRGFLVELDPSLDLATAARRRDLTINSIAYDPLTGDVLDPHRGLEDLEAGVLRATDPSRFAEDSLRGLRVAQFVARFEMQPDAELHRLCGALDLSDLPGERLFAELRKLLLKGTRPSSGLEFMRTTGLLAIFPELEAMIGVPQDPQWHPEGTVWEHTLLVVDEAASARRGDEDDLPLLLGALCHDLGKPPTTVCVDGRVRSPEHDEVGVPLTESFLNRLRAPHDLIAKVCALVRHHLAPASLVKGGAKDRGYRRLARRLSKAGVDSQLLYRLARCDHFGRTTPDALAREFEFGDDFLRRMEDLSIAAHADPDVVLGRHLIERGFKPGPWFGNVLKVCREIQDDTGWRNHDRILDRALEQIDAP